METFVALAIQILGMVVVRLLRNLRMRRGGGRGCCGSSGGGGSSGSRSRRPTHIHYSGLQIFRLSQRMNDARANRQLNHSAQSQRQRRERSRAFLSAREEEAEPKVNSQWKKELSPSARRHHSAAAVSPVDTTCISLYSRPVRNTSTAFVLLSRHSSIIDTGRNRRGANPTVILGNQSPSAFYKMHS